MDIVVQWYRGIVGEDGEGVVRVGCDDEDEGEDGGEHCCQDGG